MIEEVTDYDDWEEDMYGVQCSCGKSTVVVTAECTGNDPCVCNSCGAKYWREGYRRGKIMRKQCQPSPL